MRLNLSNNEKINLKEFMNKDSIKDSIEEIIAIHTDRSSKLDEISSTIAHIEKSLQAAKIFCAFKYEIDGEQMLEWNKCPQRSGWRLLYSGIFDINRKPLAEAPLEQRISFSKHLEPFMKKYKDHIINNYASDVENSGVK